jgi:GWxTD domain-containing protein
VATREDALAFIRSFWLRRDPTPGDEANPFADAFSERVAIADQLFTEEAVRGALTDRGGALIVLGSPHSVKLLRRRAPALKPGRPPRSGDGALRAEDVEVERWRYTRAAVAEHLPGLDLPEEIELEFVRRPNRVSWVSGRTWIERAARSAVRKALP